MRPALLDQASSIIVRKGLRLLRRGCAMQAQIASTKLSCTTCPTPFTSLQTRRKSCPLLQKRLLTCKAQAGGADEQARVQQALSEAMKDPAARARMEQMQSMMQSPEVQRQMQEMAAFMSNQSVMQRMAELKEDPELKPIFDKIKTGGMGALMQYMNDPRVLAKIGEKLGDLPNEVAAQAGAAGASAAAAAPPDVEITNLLDAARAGDVEAVEDFVAIGKDVNEKDEEGRTPLHYAVAYNHGAVVKALLEGEAAVESTDSQGNTPLHYAAGYGRTDALRMLLDAGANVAAKNANDKSALELIQMAPANPLNRETELLARLQATVQA